MKKQRKHYTPEEKVAVLRRHLLEHEPISKLCDELGLQPTVFYRWQKEFFENGAAAFEQKARPNRSADQERLVYLEKKIQTKDEVGRTHGGARRAKKRDWGTLIGTWVPHDTRDQIVDFVRRWSETTEIGVRTVYRVDRHHCPASSTTGASGKVIRKTRSAMATR